MVVASPGTDLLNDTLFGENPCLKRLTLELLLVIGSLPRPPENLSHFGLCADQVCSWPLLTMNLDTGIIFVGNDIVPREGELQLERFRQNHALFCYYGEHAYEISRHCSDCYTRVVPSGYVRSQGEQLQFAVVSNCLDLCDDADFYGFYATDAAIVQHLSLWFSLFSFDKQQAVVTFGFWLMFATLKDCFMTSPSRSELLVFNVDEHLLLWNDPHVSPAVFCGDMSLFICIWNGLLLKELKIRSQYCFLSHKDMMAHSLSGVNYILGILSFVAAIIVQKGDSLFACCSHNLEQNFSQLQSHIAVYISQINALKVVTHYGGLTTLLWFLFGSLSRPPEAQEVTNSSSQVHIDASLIEKVMEETHMKFYKSKSSRWNVLPS